jgi:xylulokinase
MKVRERRQVSAPQQGADAGGRTEQAVVLIGIDTGTYTTKGVACLTDGTVIAEAHAAHEISVPRPGFAEQDADGVWWRDFCLVARRLVSSLPPNSKVAALAVSGMGPCLVPADDKGRALRPAMLYGVDARSEQQISELEARIGRVRIARLSGCRLTSQYVGPKILWLKENEPDVFVKTTRFLTTTSYLLLRLTGSYVVDQHQASYFAPFADLKHGRWDLRYADDLLNQSLLPEIRWSHEVAGGILPEVCEATGLEPGTPVVVGSTDGVAEALSVGVVDPGDIMVTYGSAAVLMLVIGEPRSAPNLWPGAGAFPGTYTLTGGPSATGSITSWFRRELAREMPQRSSEEIGRAHGMLASEASQSPPGANGLLMLPYFSGERSPISDPNARGVLAGLNLSHTRGDMYRAILEASGLAARHTMEQMESTGAQIRRVVAVGGGSISSLWVQIMSNVTGHPQDMPVARMGASYGDAFLAGLAIGAVKDMSSLRDQWVHISHRVEPDPRTRDCYDRLYNLYLDLYRKSRSTVHGLAALERAALPELVPSSSESQVGGTQ